MADFFDPTIGELISESKLNRLSPEQRQNLIQVGTPLSTQQPRFISKFCNQCGKLYKPTNFCSHCGKKQ